MSSNAQNVNLAIALATLATIAIGLLSGCNESTQVAAKGNVVSQTAIVDTSITLEEPPNFVLQDPLCLAVSPSGKYLAMTDRATGLLMVYEIDAGRLMTTYRTSIYLMDSVVDAMSSWPFKNVVDSNKASLLRFSQVVDEKGKPYTPEKLSREMPSRVLSCVFVSDSVVMMGVELNGAYRRIDEHGRGIQGSYPVTGLIEFEINSKRVRVRPFDASLLGVQRPYVPQPEVIVRRTASGTFLLSCLYMQEVDYSDVRPIIEVDAEWKEIRRFGTLPMGLRNKAFRDFHSEIAMTDIPGTDRELVAFRMLPYIFDYSRGTSFQLHISSDNQEYLNGIIQWNKDNSSIAEDSVAAKANFAVQNMEWMGGDSLLVVLWHRGDSAHTFLLLGQEFRTSGEFLRSYVIAEAEDEGLLPKVAYNVPMQRLVVVQSNDSTWQLRLMRSPQ